MYFVCWGDSVHVVVRGQLSGVGSLLHLVEGLVFLLLHELLSNSALPPPTSSREHWDYKGMLMHLVFHLSFGN